VSGGLAVGAGGLHRATSSLDKLSLKGTSKNAVHGIFLHAKAKNVVFTFVHFQSLVAIENGGTSLCRTATSIFRGALKRR